MIEASCCWVVILKVQNIDLRKDIDQLKHMQDKQVPGNIDWGESTDANIRQRPLEGDRGRHTALACIHGTMMHGVVAQR